MRFVQVARWCGRILGMACLFAAALLLTARFEVTVSPTDATPIEAPRPAAADALHDLYGEFFDDATARCGRPLGALRAQTVDRVDIWAHRDDVQGPLDLVLVGGDEHALDDTAFEMAFVAQPVQQAASWRCRRSATNRLGLGLGLVVVGVALTASAWRRLPAQSSPRSSPNTSASKRAAWRRSSAEADTSRPT